MGSKKSSTSTASKSSKSVNSNLGRKNHGNASNIRGCSSSGEVLDQSEYLSFTKDQLKTELKRRGLKASGTKTELVCFPNNFTLVTFSNEFSLSYESG
jgi:hypothetical protein